MSYAFPVAMRLMTIWHGCTPSLLSKKLQISDKSALNRDLPCSIPFMRKQISGVKCHNIKWAQKNYDWTRTSLLVECILQVHMARSHVQLRRCFTLSDINTSLELLLQHKSSCFFQTLKLDLRYWGITSNPMTLVNVSSRFGHSMILWYMSMSKHTSAVASYHFLFPCLLSDL